MIYRPIGRLTQGVENKVGSHWYLTEPEHYHYGAAVLNELIRCHTCPWSPKKWRLRTPLS